MKAATISSKLGAGALTLALLALPGCGDGGSSTGPTTQEFNQAREELMVRLKKGKKGRKGGNKSRATASAGAPVPAAFGGSSASFVYAREGLRDPFRSFELEQLGMDLADSDSQTPLQQFDVSQLSVVGVVWDVDQARALIQDPSGMSYIVSEGGRIGKNEGRVIRIDDNLVVVKETYVDFMGEETTKDIEMRIRATEGG